MDGLRASTVFQMFRYKEQWDFSCWTVSALHWAVKETGATQIIFMIITASHLQNQQTNKATWRAARLTRKHLTVLPVFPAGGGAVQVQPAGEAGSDGLLQDGWWGGSWHLCWGGNRRQEPIFFWPFIWKSLVHLLIHSLNSLSSSFSVHHLVTLYNTTLE